MSDEKTCTACVDHIPTHLLDSTPTFIAHIARQTAERLTHAIAEKIHDGEEYIVRMSPVHWEQNESICEVSAKRELIMKPLVRCKECNHSYEDWYGRVCAYGRCVDCYVLDDWFCGDGEPKTK